MPESAFQKIQIVDINGNIVNTSGSYGKILLNAVTTTRTGETVNFVSCYSKFIVQLEINSGSLSAISCAIQASITGSKWQAIATISDVSDGGILFIVDRPTIQLRANLTTLTGSSPNISLYCAGVV